MEGGGDVPTTNAGEEGKRARQERRAADRGSYTNLDGAFKHWITFIPPLSARPGTREDATRPHSFSPSPMRRSFPTQSQKFLSVISPMACTASCAKHAVREDRGVRIRYYFWIH